MSAPLSACSSGTEKPRSEIRQAEAPLGTRHSAFGTRDDYDGRPARLPPADRRDGQAMIFIVMVLVILAFVAIFQFDLHKTLFVKAKSRNAGDGAALAGARWQGVALNLVGELNVMQAVAILQGLAAGQTNFPEAEAIADLTARMCFVGPMTGFMAAQQAAKNNGLYINNDYTRALAEHAAEVRNEYPTRYPDPPYLNDPDPPGAWDDYADMLTLAANQGVAVAPDNMRLYNDYMNYDHFLLNPSFYDAIASADWCWFWFNAYSLLLSYTSWQDWPDLPTFNEPQPINSEIFSLNLRRATRLANVPQLIPTNLPAVSVGELLDALEGYTGMDSDPRLASVAATWYCYSDHYWQPWTDWIPEGFPFRSDIKPQYDYLGADTAVRSETTTDRLTPGVASADITWSAAAKPFGSLDEETPPNAFGIVLPAFQEIRLIPIDASTAPAGGSRPGWGIHIHNHLPPYTQVGLSALDGGCWYCQQLVTWENAAFRNTGKIWLVDNHENCHVPPPGSGGGPGGGGRRGH